MQARSTARLTTLLDAAAAVVDEIGYERLTTAMVATRAGASIGTVYRYFPDRIAVLQALSDRNLQRLLACLNVSLADESRETWSAALGAAFDDVVDSYRSEPGFRGLRVGDVLDLRPAPQSATFNSVVAHRVLECLASRFEIRGEVDSALRIEAAVEVCDALLARAFARDHSGDEAFLDAARGVTLQMITPLFEADSPAT